MFNLAELRISTTFYLAILFIPLNSTYAALALAGDRMIAFWGNLVGIALASVLLWQIKTNNHIVESTNLVTGYLVLFVVALIFTGEGSLMWLLSAPPLALLCLGTKPGLCIGMALIPVLVIGLFYPELFSLTHYPDESKPYTMVVYFVILVTSATFSRILEIGEMAANKADSHIQNLESMLSMCMHCKKINVNEDWHALEDYVARENKVSHGLCPHCEEFHYGAFLKQQTTT